MEKVLWLIKYVKSGLQSSVLQLSLWTVVHSWVDQLKFDSNQIETLIENNQCYTTWEIANILKISKSIKLLVKRKNVSFMLWKKKYRLFGHPNIWPSFSFFLLFLYLCYWSQVTSAIKLYAFPFWLLHCPLSPNHLFIVIHFISHSISHSH